MTSDFAEELRGLRAQRGMSVRDLAQRAHCGKTQIHDLETGRRRPTEAVARGLDEAFGTNGRLVDMLRTVPPDADDDAEIEAIELGRRVTASDVSNETLDAMERAADRAAMAYATTPPAELLPRVRKHLDYVTSLVDARKTLAQQRRLFVVGGWFSLLRATLHIDLRQAGAADAYLLTASQLAEQAQHPEIAAWCLETQAWDVLTAGDFRQALELSQHAQAIAPAGGSALVQATAQEGRAWARLGDRTKTRDALDRVERLTANRPAPEHPEHHYQYDPAKARSYTATTLAWSGDPAAEIVAREVITELEADGARPRRVASAHLDLGLALLAAEKPDEAAAAASQAITSGRVVASNWWRAREVMAGVQRSGVHEAAELRDTYETFRPQLGA